MGLCPRLLHPTATGDQKPFYVALALSLTFKLKKQGMIQGAIWLSSCSRKQSQKYTHFSLCQGVRQIKTGQCSLRETESIDCCIEMSKFPGTHRKVQKTLSECSDQRLKTSTLGKFDTFSELYIKKTPLTCVFECLSLRFSNFLTFLMGCP